MFLSGKEKKARCNYKSKKKLGWLCNKCLGFFVRSVTVLYQVPTPSFLPLFYGPFGSSSYSPFLRFYGNNFRRFLIVMTISHSSWLCCTLQHPAPKICGFGRHITTLKLRQFRAIIERQKSRAFYCKIPNAFSNSSIPDDCTEKRPQKWLQCNFRQTDESIHTFFAKVLLWVEWLLSFGYGSQWYHCLQLR